MGDWIRLFIIGLVWLLFPSGVVCQELQAEFDQITNAFEQSRFKDCQLLCDSFIANHADVSASDLNFIKAIQAKAMMSLGHLDEGLSQLQSIERDMQGLLNHSSKDYIEWVFFLSTAYFSVDTSHSLQLLQQVIDYYEDHDEYTNQNYIAAMLWLGLYYNNSDMDNTRVIDQILGRVLPVIEKNYGHDNDLYGQAIMLATYNAEAKNDPKTQLRMAEEWIHLQGNNLTENSKARFLAYSQKLKALVSLKQYEEFNTSVGQYTSLVQKDCMDSYLNIPTNERLAVLSYVQVWFFNLIPELLGNYSSNELAQIAYDGLLFAKGLMQKLEVSKDSNDCALDPLKISWKQVQQSLKSDEAAVEFVCRSFTRLGIDFQSYQALIIRPGYDAPHIIQLGLYNREHKELQERCDFFWQPLMSELSDVKTVFFSPHGQLHNLPTENFLPKSLQSCNFYRLSSTRQIVLSKSPVGHDAAIYGGLAYDMEEGLARIDGTQPRQRGAVVDVSFLKGTETEAKMVANVIKVAQRSNFKVFTFSGDEGTEKSFRALSGKNLRVIHMATHGFYYQEDELISFAKMLSTSGISQGRVSQLEDRPLSRSGLILSGAKQADLYGAINTTPNDGILTAQEVSELDFSGLELISLSACETAQGKISGDGVFGLQRGFKKAGAQSILMSLWKVDDEATCLLMTEFYKNWMGGATKHDALEMAKQTVRSHTEKGWDDPKYWAAFILLDALD